MRKNQRKPKRPIAVIDAETDPFKRGRVPQPFVWGFYDGSRYLCFEQTERLVEFLKQENCICYAHNGGKFDFHFLLEWLEPYEELTVINGRIARVPFGLCELRDSYCIIPAPLDAVEKEKIDYSIMEADVRDLPDNREKIRRYLRSDCVNLWNMVTKFIDDYGLNLTLASTAMKQWTAISPYEVPFSDVDFYNDMSAYYYGGRVQCFQSGVIEKPFSVYDINSAYPFAMLQKHCYSTNYGVADKYIKGADFYDVECVSRGAFPWRGDVVINGRKTTGLQFPDDGERRVYHVTRWEYDAAVKTKTIDRVKVLRSISFMQHCDFSEYINHFYKLRAECKANGDKAGSLFCKLLMNSLYGKFAANPQEYRNHMIVPMDVIGGLSGLGWRFAGEFGPWGMADAPMEEYKQRFYNVATGASITGFVRAMLWRAICGSGDVIYCDTDSIAVGYRGDGLMLGDKLGEWKHEGDFIRAWIAGKKLYAFEGAPGWWLTESGDPVCQKRKPVNGSKLIKTASKGVRLGLRELKRAAKGAIVEYESETPTFSVKHAPRFVARKVKLTA